MFASIRNPSPAMRKRLFDISILSDCPSDIQDRIAEMKIIKAAFKRIETMDINTIPFHGYDSVESLVKVLTEFGIDKQKRHHSALLHLLRETNEDDEFYSRGISKAGKALEKRGYSAALSIKASLLAASGFEDDPFVRERIAHSVECFKAVLAYESIAEFAVKKGATWVYREGKLFPDYYNLRLLAFSQSWRNVETLRLMVGAFERLVALQPIPQVYIPHKGQLIAPGSYLMQEFDTDYLECSDDHKAEWLLRNECLARMGILDNIASLTQVHKNLAEPERMLERSKEIEKTGAFRKWGAYSGVSLEDDWRKEERKINDIAFRLGLIEYYRNLPKNERGEAEGRTS